jgi:hypothetical protein
LPAILRCFEQLNQDQILKNQQLEIEANLDKIMTSLPAIKLQKMV